LMWLLISQVERKKKMEQYSHDVGMLVVVFDLQNETAFNLRFNSNLSEVILIGGGGKTRERRGSKSDVFLDVFLPLIDRIFIPFSLTAEEVL
jgi:hypothetical protein